MGGTRGIDGALDQVSRELGERFGLVADVFARWREPEVARAVVDSLLAGDGAAFRDLLPGGGLEPFMQCFWWQDVVEVVVSTPAETRWVCRLRTDLTPEERQRYIEIVLQFAAQGDGPVVVQGPPNAPDLDLRGREITPGDFLDALKAAGLVTCGDEVVQTGGGLAQVIGKPEEICIGIPPV